MMEDNKIYNQWTNPPSKVPQIFTLPTLTVPDQSMTIAEIIAKYTRTGLVPQSFARKDEGGNTAFEPGFDPLDEYTEIQAEAAASAHGSDSEGQTPPSSEPAQGEAAS